MGGAKLKVKRLLIPQITLSLTIVVLNGSIWIVDGNNFSQFDFFTCFGFWFLPVLFLCSMYFMCLSAIVNLNNKWIRLGVMIIIIALALIVMQYKPTPSNMILGWVTKSPVAFLFFACGSFLKSWACSPMTSRQPKLGLLIVEMTPLLVVLSLINTPVMMYIDDYGHYPLFLVTSALGIYLIVELSKRLQCCHFFQRMGNLSVAIYVWNFLVVGFAMRLINRVMVYCDYVNEMVLTASTFCVSVLVLYMIATLTCKYVPFIYGKK